MPDNIDNEIADLERKRDAAWREYHYYDGQIFRLQLKAQAISQEECSRIKNLIGKNVREGA